MPAGGADDGQGSDQPAHRAGVAFEPRYDGFRALVVCTRTAVGAAEVVVQSRQQRTLTAHFPDIAAAINTLDSDVVLDGELVIWRTGRLDFGERLQLAVGARSRRKRRASSRFRSRRKAAASSSRPWISSRSCRASVAVVLIAIMLA